MDLWIRSQNKITLKKSNELLISHTDKNIWSILDNADMTRLGEYKTKERALEVLDEIQSHLVVINDKNDNYFYVYEMPIE